MATTEKYDNNDKGCIIFIANTSRNQCWEKKDREITYGVDSRFVPSQWEMGLLCNNVSHWLGTNLESALIKFHT